MAALPRIESEILRAVRFARFGEPDVLEVVDNALPEPGPGEVRVRVEAASVQFTDTLIRRGLYPDLRGRPPFTPGYDFVGIVDVVGEGVTEFAVGDRVADLTTIGSNATHVVRPAGGLVPVPRSVDAAEATTLVLSWISAQQAIFRSGELKRGERLLVVGGNGAVGLAAIVLAVEQGAEVYATAAERHHEMLRSLGATPLPREGWQGQVREMGGVDVVLDGIAADGFRSSYRALRRGGRLVAIGASAAAQARSPMWSGATAFLRVLALWPLLPDGRRSRLYSITKHRQAHPEHFREDLGTLFELLAKGRIRPVVAERIGFEEVAHAHARLEAGGLRGKIVLVPDAR